MKTKAWLVVVKNMVIQKVIINEIMYISTPVGVSGAYKFVLEKYFDCESLDESAQLVIELSPIYTSYTYSPYGVGDIDYTE